MKAGRFGLIVVALMVSAGLAWAEQGDQPPAPAKAAAQAQSQAAPAPKVAAPAPGSAPMPDRVTALEKQNLVLTEDIGKARLEARAKLEELAKRQAAEIARLNQELAQQRAQAQADREKQQGRNRKLWIAVGVLAIGVLASN